MNHSNLSVEVRGTYILVSMRAPAFGRNFGSKRLLGLQC